MPNFTSLMLSEIADKLHCTLINAYYFNLKLNVYNNPPSACIASFTSSKYSQVKMIHMTYIPDLHALYTKKTVVGTGKSRALK